MNKQKNQKLVRTTLRLKADLKKAAAKLAVEEGTTLQKIFNEALKDYVDKRGRKKAGEITFITHNLGRPLDNLTRDDYYPDPLEKLNP